MEKFNHLFENSEANKLPPGFRFHPTDEELITYYLLKKVFDSTFAAGRAIAEIDLNKCEPWQLPERAKMGEKEWYFFSLRDRKYPTGLRTNRATEAGYWKATGKDREIYSTRTGALVGMKKTLVFYKGRAPKGEKTNWVMHEYRLEGKFAYHFLSRSSKDEWVISRVFQKVAGKSKSITPHSLADPIQSPSLSSPRPYNNLLDSTSARSYESTTNNTLSSSNGQLVVPHVPCFSMMINSIATPVTAAAHPWLSVPFCKSTTTGCDNATAGASRSNAMFPSLRSLQENLQLPSFLSAFNGGGDAPQTLVNEVVDSGCGTELDCMWTF